MSNTESDVVKVVTFLVQCANGFFTKRFFDSLCIDRAKDFPYE